jgi:hypothetical protein
MCKRGGGVGGSNEVKGAVCGGVVECDEGIAEGVEAIGDAVVDIAVEIGGAYEAMDNLSAHLNKICESQYQLD